MSKTTVLVVDDSTSMRSFIINSLQQDPLIEVIGQATDALSAREAIKALNPDVITLDIEMPSMNGLDFLEKIMRLRPMPVVMVSSLTKRVADATIRAIELGAVDCVAKPTVDDPNTFDDLAVKVRSAKKARLRPMRSNKVEQAARRVAKVSGDSPDLIAIGASTGGVEAIITVLQEFPADCPPTLITQHMPPTFTKSFAARLDKICAARVKEAANGDPLVPGHVYLAPGGDAHLEVSGGSTYRCALRSGDRISGHRPSVDALFQSVAQNVGEKAAGVILTGMGNDGERGLLAMREAGARTIGQDQDTSVVYGMPRAAFEAGAVGTQLPVNKIANEIFQN